MMAAYQKPCVVSRRGSRDRHGVAAGSLQDLLEKACNLFGLDATETPISLVLAEDGTIVEDEDYFLCLPPNTKFVVLTGSKKWAPTVVDGGTAWLARASVSSFEEVDGAEIPLWKKSAMQLRENLSNIILMSESDLQTLINVPAGEMATELGTDLLMVQKLQDTLQGVLDRREEERQSKQLLELYLEAAKEPGTEERAITEVDSGRNKPAQPEPSGPVQLSSQLIKTLNEREMPHLSLSNQELEVVTSLHTEALAMTLCCQQQKAQDLRDACQQELQKREEQIHCLLSLSSVSHSKKQLP
ncbi:DNA fragmentation factor subunit alpha [Bombina bombina]|uniref:DNA fragmentation factor subunit alpha n=1 Tax=Bombina bombina TaxID=8345 RepID=UPI00235AEDF0|nr:DNA fragmentation factor subunit alpha [Bombina bombina]